MLKTSKSTGRRYCPDHPRYLAKRKPILACEDCWTLWLGLCETCINAGCQREEADSCETIFGTIEEEQDL